MNVEKNKLVFGSVVLVVILFILAYTYMVMLESDDNNVPLQETVVPELEEKQKEYSSKLDALNDLKEVRQTNAPSIYDEKFLDSSGVYDPDLPKKKKERLLDSLYGKYSDRNYPSPEIKKFMPAPQNKTAILDTFSRTPIASKELGLEHQLFFSANPKPIISTTQDDRAIVLKAVVDGDQILKTKGRLQLRLTQSAIIGPTLFPANTKVYGVVTFQPNRVMITIENISHMPLSLKAYDLQDGLEGIYIENSFRSDASREVVDDIVQDINLPGVPQVQGIKRVFQRNNRTIKVFVSDNYQLLLKSQITTSQNP